MDTNGLFYKIFAGVGWIAAILANIILCYRMFFIAGEPTNEVKMMIYFMLFAIALFGISNFAISYSPVYKFVMLFSLIINSIAGLNMCTYLNMMPFTKFLIIQSGIALGAYLVAKLLDNMFS